jgi:hypothetical protein
MVIAVFANIVKILKTRLSILFLANIEKPSYIMLATRTYTLLPVSMCPTP